MIVKQAEFVISAMGPDQYPDDDLPEIALAGRSNVGKSSLINCLLQRKNLARRSATPGKTQSLNYYAVDAEVPLYLVDFPGYGYAKVSKTMRERWGEMIEHYFMNRSDLRLVLLVVDLRHQPSNDDVAMYEWLRYYDIPCAVIATKADKITKGKWEQHRRVVRQGLGLEQGEPLITFSSESGLGREPLWDVIREYIS